MNTIFEWLWSNDPIRAVQQFFGMEWLWLFLPVTYFGAHEAAALVAALALWLSGRRLAYAVIGIVALALATDMLLWQIIGVPRPSGPSLFVYKEAPVSSFPSGHVVTATVVWGLLARRDRIWNAAAVAIVLAVMLSRIYLGMHYVGDVLAGAAIGFALLVVFGRVWPVIERWLAGRSQRFFAIGGLGLAVAVLPFTFVTDRAWLVFGAAVGAVLGLIGEYRYLDYTPQHTSALGRAAQVLVGVGVAAALIWAGSALGLNVPAFDAVIFALVALWLTFGAPAVFSQVFPARQPQMER